MCTGKASHKDQAAADEAVRRSEWDQSGGPALRSYQCDYCGRWHLTSQPSR